MADCVESMIGDLVAQEDERRATGSEHGPRGPLQCPDGGHCGHRCNDTCWRSIYCMPFTAYGDEWLSTEPVAVETVP